MPSFPFILIFAPETITILIYEVKMKRFVLFLAALSLTSLAQAQGSENNGFAADFSVVSRLEANPWINFSGSPKKGIDLGSSSLYFLGDGQFTENLTFSFMLNPLNTDPAALYDNTFRGDGFNWLNWASLTWSFGDFSLTAGKSYFYCATFEEDDYDYDRYAFLSSSVWNNFPIYQWGAAFGWQPSEQFSLSANVFTSPYGEYIFTSGLFGFSGIASCEMGGLSAKLGAAVMPDGRGNWIPVISCGLKAEVGQFTFINDFYSKACDEYDFFMDSLSDVLSIAYRPSEKWNFSGHFAVDLFKTVPDPVASYRAGAVCEFFPLEGLRLHAMAGYEAGSDNRAVFSLGATYNFSFSL